MLKHATAGARRRWPILLLSLVSVTALALSAFTLLASADNSPTPTVIPKAFSNVPTGRADAITDFSDAFCTVSPSFNDMPGMTKTFTQGGTVSKPVIVLFEGEWTGFGAGVAVDVQLTIDGVVHSRAVLVQSRNSAELSQLGTHGFNFVSDPLAPGPHTARIQWRDNGNGQGCIRQRSLIVLHK